jgi:S1-C subfamily serine protease
VFSTDKYKPWNFLIRLLAAAIVTVSVTACASQPDHIIPYEDRSNTYLSDTGSDLLRDQIKEVMESVIRIQNTVTYRTYQFSYDSLPRESGLSGIEFEALAVNRVVESHSNAGTAMVMSNSSGRSSLISASHTVTFPDTIFHYVSESRRESDPQIEAVSVRQAVNHFMFSNRGVFEFEVIANDPSRDLAVLLYRWGRDGDPELKSLSIAPGNFDELDWTDRVYVLGYPRGIQMVTSGMVSKYAVTTRRGFAVDASFNRGFSGGPMFAVRNDGRGLAWMGILTSASAEQEFYLSPDIVRAEDLKPGLPFRGTPLIQQSSRINYGISFGADMNQIEDFYNENRSVLRRNQIPVPRFPE